ncbi:hypothetical protein [Cyclobacterium marinum]|uniref:Uncharacterized protein n=1 Tax=Cyclobacterium marinum (strain ATCC 25205 / DSM 745 / LMG 13164 / NCIMB 1802) TaxID=880070 RepID=G0J370_CYCMS|nr:hypothetical protein [Cyclobacterium marinum]AEL24011.1 hypothetical protein Cycma_0229 [Cyclobacterium marinum DSM 745]
MENLPEIGTLGSLILLGTQLLLRFFPSIGGKTATIIITILFAAIALMFHNGIGVLEVILALVGQVFVYDFVAKPIITAVRK